MQCIEVWLPCSYLDAAHRGRRGLNIFHIYYEDALRAVMDVKYYLAGKFKVRPIAGHKLNQKTGNLHEPYNIETL